MSLSGSPCGTPVSLQIPPLTYVNSLPFSTGSSWSQNCTRLTFLLPLPLLPSVTPCCPARQQSCPAVDSHCTPSPCSVTTLKCNTCRPHDITNYIKSHLWLLQLTRLCEFLCPSCFVLVYHTAWCDMACQFHQHRILPLSPATWWKGSMEYALISTLKTWFLEAFLFDNDSPQVTNFQTSVSQFLICLLLQYHRAVTCQDRSPQGAQQSSLTTLQLLREGMGDSIWKELGSNTGP